MLITEFQEKILCTSHHQECGEAKAYLSVARYLGRLLYAQQALARRRLRYQDTSANGGATQ